MFLSSYSQTDLFSPPRNQISLDKDMFPVRKWKLNNLLSHLLVPSCFQSNTLSMFILNWYHWITCNDFSCLCGLFYFEAHPMSDITACMKVTIFFSSWISCFGVTAVITTNRKHQFKSDLFLQLLNLHYANSMVKMFHHRLKSILKVKINHHDWLEKTYYLSSLVYELQLKLSWTVHLQK